jgi:hypothetical protein
MNSVKFKKAYLSSFLLNPNSPANPINPIHPKSISLLSLTSSLAATSLVILVLLLAKLSSLLSIALFPALQPNKSPKERNIAIEIVIFSLSF